MKAAVVGAGPTGLYLAMTLARRGHQVQLVERDPGPVSPESWPRKGVMQFHAPHGFRMQVHDALAAELPDVLDQLVADGAERIRIPELPGAVISVRCRRTVFERRLRAAAGVEPGVEFVLGGADALRIQRGRVVGLTVDGREFDADLVIDASGRGGRLGDNVRAPAVGGSCGVAYISRTYRLRRGAEPGPFNAPVGLIGSYDGYRAFVFAHEHGNFSTLIMRLTTDAELARLRSSVAYDAATRVIPELAVWADPARARPTSAVRPGAGLRNAYRGQLGPSGGVAAVGAFFVGDSVCITNPSAGRGVATSLLQARELLRLLDVHGDDHESSALALEAYNTEQIRPWFDDHVAMDADQIRRWNGADVDASRLLPSDLICAASEADPSMGATIGRYLAMIAPPQTLTEIEPRARELYAGGWRPPVPDGPTRNELAALVRETLAA
ncbi:MAG: FAD-dependent monooxygenase [bacterium]